MFVFLRNMSEDLTLLIMAAGMGTRYGGSKQTEVFNAGENWLMDYALFDAYHAGFHRAVVITRPSMLEGLQEHILERWQDVYAFSFVLQGEDHASRSKPWGTAHAVLCASEHIKAPFALVNADDFYGRSAYMALGGYLMGLGLADSIWAMVSYRLGETLSGTGGVSRGLCSCDEAGFLTHIEEKTSIVRGPKGIVYEGMQEGAYLRNNMPVSMNAWGFTPALFPLLREAWEAFYALHKQDEKAEFFIPTVVSSLMTQHKAKVRVLEEGKGWMGITYKADKQKTEEVLQALTTQGVYPPKIDKQSLQSP